MLINKVILWTPRILSIMLIIFLSMFSFDVFELDDVSYRLALGFVVHNIPVIVLVIALIFSWKYPLVGACTYIGAGIFYAIWMLIAGEPVMVDAIFILGLPAVIIGVLFLISSKKSSSSKTQHSHRDKKGIIFYENDRLADYSGLSPLKIRRISLDVMIRLHASLCNLLFPVYLNQCFTTDSTISTSKS